jgi:hypothetical protein
MLADLDDPPAADPHDDPEFRVARARSDYLSVSRHAALYVDYALAESRAWARRCAALRAREAQGGARPAT